MFNSALVLLAGLLMLVTVVPLSGASSAAPWKGANPMALAGGMVTAALVVWVGGLGCSQESSSFHLQEVARLLEAASILPELGVHVTPCGFLPH